MLHGREPTTLDVYSSEAHRIEELPSEDMFIACTQHCLPMAFYPLISAEKSLWDANRLPHFVQCLGWRQADLIIIHFVHLKDEGSELGKKAFMH